jgi:predicted DsbA family dithiol-disulfide isomerase
MNSETASLRVDIVSDVVCPWCHIGQKRLQQALAQVPEIAVDLHWRPYQLDPTVPEGGLDRQQYMLSKFGSAERIASIHERVAEAGRSAGIDFAFDAIKVSPNTLDAHRLIRWAGAQGSEAQTRLARRLFALYFEEGANIGSHEVLLEAAREAGLDTAVIEPLLASDADTDAVKAEIETAQRMGVTGVPCFLIENKYAVMGAQEPEALADALRQISAAKERGELDGPAAN